MFFIVIFYYNIISSIAPLTIGKVTENTINVNPHIDCIIFVIPMLFFAGAFVCILKKLYVPSSMILGVVSALLMFLYSDNEYEKSMVNWCFLFMGVLCVGLVAYIMIRIKPETEKDMSFLGAIMMDMSTSKKFVLAVVWMSVCIACLVYVITPKKWIYVYFDSNYSYDEMLELNEDDLVMGEEVKNIGDLWGRGVDFKYNEGWRFYPIKKGNTQVSISYKSVLDDETYKEIWDIYVDNNMYVHHSMDYDYYLDVYMVYIVLSVIAAGFGFIFLIAGVKSTQLNKCRDKIGMETAS